MTWKQHEIEERRCNLSVPCSADSHATRRAGGEPLRAAPGCPVALWAEANQATALCLSCASVGCSTTRDVLLWFTSWDLSKRPHCTSRRGLRSHACCMVWSWHKKRGRVSHLPNVPNICYRESLTGDKSLLCNYSQNLACQARHTFTCPRSAHPSRSKPNLHLGFRLASKDTGKLRAAWFRASPLPPSRNTSGFASI